MLEIEPSVRDFYARVMRTLVERELSFLVCGAFALRHHVGFGRPTRDLDLMIVPDDVERLLAVFRDAGMTTSLAYPHWLAKIFDESGELFVDILWSSGNGVARVDEACFEHATSGTLFDVPVRFCPIEEMIWSKAYVMERERFDGADVAHLLHHACDVIDWERLLTRFEPHRHVLLAHLVLLEFIYPEDHARIPAEVREELLRSYLDGAPETEAFTCGGTLLSREQYLTDLALGHRDARLTQGTMSAADIAHWTAAIRSK